MSTLASTRSRAVGPAPAPVAATAPAPAIRRRDRSVRAPIEAAVASPPVKDAHAWDRAMVDRISVGDDSALAAVFDRYGAVVHAIASSCVGADRANDVTQDVFVHLWRQPEGYDAEHGSLRSFLGVIARRRAIDMVRSGQRRSAREQRAAVVEASRGDGVEEAALGSVLAERVRAAVARLPAEQREAIELAYFGGLTFREVARVTHTAEGTTKSRLRLGLARLARELQRQAEVGGVGGEVLWN